MVAQQWTVSGPEEAAVSIHSVTMATIEQQMEAMRNEVVSLSQRLLLSEQHGVQPRLWTSSGGRLTPP